MASSTARTILPDSVATQALTYHAQRQSDAAVVAASPAAAATCSYAAARAEMVDGRRSVGRIRRGSRCCASPACRFTVRTGPIVYRFADPARGEVRRPVATVPEITVLLQHEVEYARANAPFDRTMSSTCSFGGDGAARRRRHARAARGLRADTATRRVIAQAVRRREPLFPRAGKLAAGPRLDQRDRDEPAASVRSRLRADRVRAHSSAAHTIGSRRCTIEAVNATFANLSVGYIRGVGDNVMPMLEELGLPVTELDPATLPQTNLVDYTTIVLGTRAYEASPALVANNAVLMRFARNGGTVVTQYGQSEYDAAGNAAVSDHAEPPGRSRDRRDTRRCA